MKPFHTIAIPHKDILEGKLTLNLFAADLWEVYKNNAPLYYRDKDEFFRKTYITKGLSNLLNIVHKRLEGKGGDPVIQLQTPFGGGKTHSLIALYHKAKEWNASVIVTVGTTRNDKLWEMFEEQLSNQVNILKGNVSPGRDKIIKVLSKHQPLLILMDEILEYITKSAGIKIEDSTLASQTLAFMQELTEAVSLLDKTVLIITLPSSIIEHYDEITEKFYQQLQKICGRIEKIYTPVEEDEITEVIRKRLFSKIDNSSASEIINKFIEYLENENILPNGLEPSEYKELFKKSYPFLPEVIKVLYERWGSLPNFQRTRGVLRLLSLLIYSLKDKNIPYISLSDFNLSNSNIRSEIINYIGPQFESVISSDITSIDSGAKKVDQKLCNYYKGLKIGTRTATTIFMYSFSGGKVKGATKNEIKRVATTINNPSSIVGEALEELKSSLFYLQSSSGKYFFSNEPNLNRIILTKMDNVSDEEIEKEEKSGLKKIINKSFQFMTPYLWVENSSNIPDNKQFKLIILKDPDENIIKEITNKKGNFSRIYKNNMFFLVPFEDKKVEFFSFVKKFIAYKNILQDKTLNLNKSQYSEIKERLKEAENNFGYILRRLYRLLYIPNKDSFKKENIGEPIVDSNKKISINEEVFEFLLNKTEILKNLSPYVIEQKYLKSKDYVKISQIYEASLNSKGEIRLFNIDVLLKAIKEGVKQGIFGLGQDEKNTIKCLFFKEEPHIIEENMFILNKNLCSKLLEEKKKKISNVVSEEIPKYEPSKKSQSSNNKINSTDSTKEEEEEGTNHFQGEKVRGLYLFFKLPKGKALEIGRMINFLNLKFENISITIDADDGFLFEQEIENNIVETLVQIGVKKAQIEVKR